MLYPLSYEGPRRRSSGLYVGERPLGRLSGRSGFVVDWLGARACGQGVWLAPIDVRQDYEPRHGSPEVNP